MLQTQQQSQEDRDLIIETEKGSGLSGRFGEGDARGEEVSVVIVPNKTIFRREYLDDASGPVCPGACRILVEIHGCCLWIKNWRGIRIWGSEIHIHTCKRMLPCYIVSHVSLQETLLMAHKAIEYGAVIR